MGPLLDNEKGNVTVFFVAISLGIALTLVLAINIGVALFQKTAQENDLAIACDQVESSAFGLVVKNSNTPELDIAKEIVATLRENGTQAKAHIYICEANESEVPFNKRAIAYYVVLEGEYLPIVGGNITGPITVANASAGYLIPYATDTAWRPSSTATGEYIAQEGQTGVTRNAIGLTSMPDTLQQTLDKAIEEANDS